MIDREFHLLDHDLYIRTFEMAAQIPSGKVSTYGAIARALGDVAASRAVGQIMSADVQRPFKVPCHRVIYSDGRTGWYTGMGKGAERKQELLRSEGVPIADGRVQDLKRYLFEDFKGEAILAKMAASQREVASLVTEDGGTDFERVAGMDVSYHGDTAFAAMVVVDRDGNVIEERTARCHVSFPYVPTYLGFREMRPYTALIDGGREDTIYLIDGHGRAHPRRAGIACQFGVVHGVASAGVAKTILTGAMKGSSLILDGSEVGRLVKSSSGRTYFVSVGNRAGLGYICDLVASMPKDPLILAHRLCNKERRNG